MLGIRLDAETEAGLARMAKQSRRSKSDIAREVLARHVRNHDDAMISEARRQSINASAHDDPEEWAFWEAVAAADDK